MTETSGSTLRRWLIESVDDLGGAGLRAEVHDRVQALFGSGFSAEDLAPRRRRGVPGEPAWRNNLDSLYDRLKKNGTFQDLPRGSAWTLSSAGLSEADAYADVDAPPVSEAELLRHFLPQSDGEYIARLEGREIIKRRDHETLIADYGRWSASKGWRPRTDVYPRDLILERPDTEVLVEAKMLYEGNATDPVRAALAQLKMYKYFLHDSSGKLILLALFSGFIGTAYSEFLEKNEIAAAWRGTPGWSGSPLAVARGLVEMRE